MKARTASAGKNYYCFFSVSLLDGVLLLELPDAAGALLDPLDGVLLDELDEGELLEPLAALPLGCEGEAPDALELEEPPEAGALGVAELELEELLSLSLSTETEPEAELELDGVDAEPDGEVVEPADEDEPGARAPVLLAASRSQAVSNPAPSARDTAAARIESLMKASVVGVPCTAARFGPPSWTRSSPPPSSAAIPSRTG
ncbi:MAG TPA: hypothetical protein VJ797_09000 [Burkholderiales bacterium]|nr:hypothetical protein [Burkholderiales bacterium]